MKCGEGIYRQQVQEAQRSLPRPSDLDTCPTSTPYHFLLPFPILGLTSAHVSPSEHLSSKNPRAKYSSFYFQSLCIISSSEVFEHICTGANDSDIFRHPRSNTLSRRLFFDKVINPTMVSSSMCILETLSPTTSACLLRILQYFVLEHQQFSDICPPHNLRWLTL